MVYVLAFTFGGLYQSASHAQSFKAEQTPDRVNLSQDGKLITSYLFRSGSKPILWPLIGPDGARMSREYPMVADSKNEEHDHLHHRSLWMTFGEVNDIDFWAEGQGKGEVVHSQILGIEQNASSASVRAKHLWRPVATPDKPDASAILSEECRYTVAGTPDERILDCEYVLTHADANSKTPIHFGDTKEGMFAMRIPESMRADKAGGHILNSAGQKDGETWGRPADWVDYSGKALPDSTSELGIGILIHPTSFGRNGYWHVRTYGLFAHNPIGVKHFIEGRSDEKPPHPAGGFSLAPGEAIHLFYRVIFHRQSWSLQQGSERFAQFSAVPAALHNAK